MRILSTFLSIVLMTTALPAQADIEVAYDHTGGVTMTYPDTWERGHNQLADEKIVIYAPGSEYARCRLRMREDNRFKVYPVRYSENIQKVAVSFDFWHDYLDEYYYTDIIKFGDDGGLSHGFASWVETSFISDQGPRIHRRGIAIASLYDGNLYISECSSSADSFVKWHKPFMKVLGSVTFKKAPEQYPTGYYRNFLQDRPLLVHGKKAVDVYVY